VRRWFFVFRHFIELEVRELSLTKKPQHFRVAVFVLCPRLDYFINQKCLISYKPKTSLAARRWFFCFSLFHRTWGSRNTSKQKNRNTFALRFLSCAHDWIRTSTPNGTTPSRWHVYQFHHVGIRGAKVTIC
jgi:hypothetical protein